MKTSKTGGSFFRHLALVGQPYWLGSLKWNPVTILIAITTMVATVFGLNWAVGKGKELTLGLMAGIDAQTMVDAVTNYGWHALAAIVGVALVAWYVGRRFKFDAPDLSVERGARSRLVAWSLLLVVLGFIVVVNVMNVVIANVSQLFTNALNSKDELSYWKWLYAYAAVFIIAIPVVGTNRWVRQVLGGHWRRWLTFLMAEKYLNSNTRAYYHINGRSDIDNPDERIHEDIRNFTDAALTLLITFLGAFITLVAFSGELWGMSKDLTWVVIGYSVVGTLVTFWLGRMLARLNVAQLSHEANFRFSLTRVRENAEAIGFYKGEARELAQSKGRFSKLYHNFRRLIGAQRNLGFFTTGFDYVVVIIPSLFLAPLYFKGQVDIGSITKATFAFRMVLGSLDVIITEFTSIARFAANVHRIGTFVEALDKPIATESKERIVTQFGDHVEFDKVTVRTPDNARTLAADLSFEVLPGKSLLIVGPSGSGKSSILRVIAGLWNEGMGVVTRPEQRHGLNNMLFLSQKPYMTLGTLREQITYPNVEVNLSAVELKAILDRVNLPQIVDDVRKALAVRNGVNAASVTDEDVFNSEFQWQDMFSPGMQQRLALARLLVSSPKTAILDEATASVDTDNESLMYDVLRASGTGYLSVGHRPSLVHHHDMVLELDGKGGWDLMTSAEYLKKIERKS